MASSVTVLTMISVLLFIFGYLCGYFHQKMGKTATTEYTQADPNCDDVMLKRGGQELELKDHVAYSSV